MQLSSNAELRGLQIYGSPNSVLDYGRTQNTPSSNFFSICSSRISQNRIRRFAEGHGYDSEVCMVHLGVLLQQSCIEPTNAIADCYRTREKCSCEQKVYVGI